MRHIIDVNTWKRKEEYLFFRTFFNPMVAVTVEVDCTQAYKKAKEKKVSFALYYLHAALVAANRIEEFRYRQEGEEVVLYDRIDLFTPVLTADGSYRSVLLPAEEEWETFRKKAMPVMEAAKQGVGEAHSEKEQGRNILKVIVKGLPGNVARLHDILHRQLLYALLSQKRLCRLGDGFFRIHRHLSFSLPCLNICWPHRERGFSG